MSAHCGYHWPGGTDRFFEGWYYRLTLPDRGVAFAFMHAIDDPHGTSPHSGGMVQVLTPDDRCLWRTLPDARAFSARRDRLELSHWNRRGEGYSIGEAHHRGHLRDPRTQSTCTWDFAIARPTPWLQSRATMGWWSYFPIFEPGWQVLCLRAQAAGWVRWQGQTHHFRNGIVYAEKNWGRSFPQRWFWLQCSGFACDPDLHLVAAGGIRETLGHPTTVAMVGLLWRNRVVAWMPENSTIRCRIAPWGAWYVAAVAPHGSIQLEGQCDRPPTAILVPTAAGLRFACRDTSQGTIRLQARLGKHCVRDRSHLAALEVGGSPWEGEWHFASAQF